jgi:hypothetical protein
MADAKVDFIIEGRKERLASLSLRLVAACILLLLGGVFSWMVMGAHGDLFSNVYNRIFLYLGLSTVGSIFIKLIWREMSVIQAQMGSMLLIAVFYRVALFLPEVSTYPFSLSWSEASWHYYASLFLSERIYGTPAPPSMFDPSRFIMLAIPYLIADTPIWLHRAWQVALWILTTVAISYLIMKKGEVSGGYNRFFFVIAVFLYLIVLPVYYHVLVIPIIVLIGYDRQSFWKTFGVVLIASAWAGISRINWAAAAGLLAATIYILETDVKGKHILRYFLPPAVWTISGGLFALLVRNLFLHFSGLSYDYFQTSLSSPLILRRLMPGITNPVGILPGVLLASIPLLLLLGFLLYSQWRKYEPVRLVSLAGILAIFFVGGVIVSIKIGGGNNLHNMDLYFLFLLIISVIVFKDWFSQEAALLGHQHSVNYLIGIIVILPVFTIVLSGGPLIERNLQRAEQVLSLIQNEVNRTVQEGGDVLFISERHLIPFGMIQNVSHIPDYEKITLMEMAISSNKPYFDIFWNDLIDRRFDLIVSNRLFVHYKFDTVPFGFENDQWVMYVGEPVLCYYEPILDIEDLHLYLLVPRKAAVGYNCP